MPEQQPTATRARQPGDPDYSLARHDGSDIGLPLAAVTQTMLHTDDESRPGNCLQAAVASLIGWDMDDVPHFGRYGYLSDEPDKHGWWWALVGFMDTCEPSFETLPLDEPPEPSDSVDDLFGMYLATGKSPRGEFNHVVVARGGQVIWDPHPSRDGIDGEVIDITYFRRRQPAPNGSTGADQ